MMKFYSNDDNPNIVIRYTEPATIHVLREGDSEWCILPPDNSYIREICIGQGNNCLTEISKEDAKKTAKRMHKNDLHINNKKSIETLF